MSEVWITHPDLTPAHDQKIPRSSLGAKVRQGWQERADQTDPAATVEPADPRHRAAPQTPATSGSSKPSPHPRTKES